VAFFFAIKSDGLTEVRRYVDFHLSSDEATDYTVRLSTGTSGLNCIGSFATTTGITSGTAFRVQAGGATITGGVSVTGGVTTTTGVTVGSALVVQAGGAAITGNSTVTGNLTVSGTVSGAISRTYVHCVAYNSLNRTVLSLAPMSASMAMPLNAHRDVQGTSPFNGSNGLFTAATAGMYLFHAQWSTATSYGTKTEIWKNGVLDADAWTTRLTHAVYLAVGDYVQVRIRHYDSVASNLETTWQTTHVTCTLL
jgi:hypothetical protein